MRALRVDELAGERQLHGHVVGDAPGESDQPAGDRHQRALDLGQPEASVARRRHQVAGQDDLEPQRHRVSLHGRDQRLARRSLDDPARAAPLDVGALAGHERLQVHAGAERAAGAGDHPGAELVVAVQLVHRGGDPLGRGPVDGVARLGPVERDEQDVLAPLGEDWVGHGGGGA